MALTRPGSVGVVVLNYRGADTTVACVEALIEHRPDEVSQRIVVVDNDGTDGVAEKLRAIAEVELVEPGHNTGFAAGCNMGIDHLRGSGAFEVDAVALVNNDVTVLQGWLPPLVEALEEGAGAAAPKIRMSGQWRRYEIEHDAKGWIHLEAVTCDGERVGGTRHRGPWELHGSHAALRGRGELLIPDADRSGPITLSLRTELPGKVTVSTDSGEVEVDLTSRPTGVLAPDAPLENVLNSAGAAIVAPFAGADRGFLDPDDGRWDRPCEISLWSGATVLLSTDYLEVVGAFDERLFMYYEDVDLSLRGQRAGQLHRYVPDSVVEHRHSAAIGAGSDLARRLDERNRLLVAARHLTWRDAALQVARSGAVTASYARRALGRRRVGVGNGLKTVTLRLRALAGMLRLLPGTLRLRRQDPWPPYVLEP